MISNKMKELGENIDFADSSYKCCHTCERDLFVILDSWDSKIIEIEFINAIRFIYNGGDFPQGIYEKTNDEILLNALKSHYEKIPQNHNFKIFIILDIQDEPIFEVISEEVIIKKYI